MRSATRTRTGYVLAAVAVAGMVCADAEPQRGHREPGANLSVEAWMGVPGLHGWPELTHPAVAGRPATGIAFSGGGSRSYTVSLAYLAVLGEMGLLVRTSPTPGCHNRGQPS
jgi:hypothetical protein